MRPRVWVFPSLALVTLLAASLASVDTLAFVPAPLLLATLAAHTAAKPARWLGALALVSELFSTQPFGVMTIVIFLPWVARRLTPRLEVGLSAGFFLYLLAVTGLQVLGLFVFSLFQGWQFFPWPAALISLLTGASAAFGLLVMRAFMLPSPWPR